jgi:hypothetical protein
MGTRAVDIRRVDWRVASAALLALVAPPVLFASAIALRGGRAFEAEGTLVVALLICLSAVAAAAVARVHSIAIGALAGEIIALGSLFYGGSPAGVPFAIAFSVGSGVLGGWWARREWGEREPRPESLPTIGAVAVLGAVTFLAMKIAFAVAVAS